MANSTPGPWKIFHGGLPGDDGFSIGTNNAAAQRAKLICECWPCSIVDNEHREELRANAMLIAAAPELADLLRELHDFSESPSHRSQQERYCKALSRSADLLRSLGL